MICGCRKGDVDNSRLRGRHRSRPSVSCERVEKPQNRSAPPCDRRGTSKLNVGGDLLSHTLTSAVPSALEGLASGFGMGPGVPPPPTPPTTLSTYPPTTTGGRP